MKKRLIVLIAMLSIAALFVGCSQETPVETPVETPATGVNEEPVTEEPAPIEEPVEKISVATTINPVDQMVKIIGGNRVETWKIVPEGSDAHDFEPTIKDMGRLTETNLLFMNGLEMEPWVEKAVENSGNTELSIIDLSTGIDLIHLDEEEDDHGDDDDHGDYDPHIWMSLDSLMIMAENVKTELTAIHPEGAEDFEKNFEAFKSEALSMKEEYQAKFEAYKGRAFVTGHAAFGYMTRELGLVQKSVEGPFQEGEPTPKKLQDLINFVKTEGITTIFLEEAASPKVSETLARETGSETVAINPLEIEGELLPSLRETYEKVLASFNE